VVTTVPAAESQSNLSASSIDAALWKTDFTRLTVDIVELLQAGVGRFGISAIAAPRTETIAEADLWLSPREPVQVVEFNGETRAYPIQLVIFHEIVNDYLGGEPVLVTYCPLCNTALSFERRVGIRVPVFDTTGVLRFSNLVMYDARTESWWQQVGGDAIVGEMAGAKLTSIPSRLTSWEEFKTSHPDGTVLSIETGFDRDYGINLYLNYDLGINRPNSVGGDEGGLSRFARVLGVSIGDEALALPFAVLEGEGVVESNVGGTDIVAFYKRGTVSALDSFLLAAGRDVGSAAAYLPVIDGTPLTFRAERGRFFDHETGSEWDLLGQSIAGPLVGETLTPVVQDNGFWFSWVAFNPDTEIYEAAPR